MRCRIFDNTGTQSDYRFTTNPIDELIDLRIRAFIKREALINAALLTAEKARFDWPCYWDSRAQCDEVLTSRIFVVLFDRVIDIIKREIIGNQLLWIYQDLRLLEISSKGIDYVDARHALQQRSHRPLLKRTQVGQILGFLLGI